MWPFYWLEFHILLKLHARCIPEQRNLEDLCIQGLKRLADIITSCEI